MVVIVKRSMCFTVYVVLYLFSLEKSLDLMLN